MCQRGVLTYEKGSIFTATVGAPFIQRRGGPYSIELFAEARSRSPSAQQHSMWSPSGRSEGMMTQSPDTGLQVTKGTIKATPLPRDSQPGVQ